MNEKKINRNQKSCKVLVAPLDWGLGHATRCVPIIHALLSQNIKVLLAAEGATKNLLQKEFPDVPILPLKGYNITYGQTKSSFVFRLLLQFPGIIRRIYKEHKWLSAVVKTHEIDAVISDNRFGLYHKKITSVYISHQLFIETGNRLLSKIAQRVHYYFVNKFSFCWVPDNEGAINLAGKLSHPNKLPATPVKYLGALSRFKKVEVLKTNDLLVMLSGPEPQRTLFENILLQQIKNIKSSIIFVRGLPAISAIILPEKDRIKYYNHLPAKDLSVAIEQSSMVVARCGYSTIMDLAAIQQKAILVPTPGQTEQEYLAGYLLEKGFFFTTNQQDFDIEKVLDKASLFPYKKIENQPDSLDRIITDFIHHLAARTGQ